MGGFTKKDVFNMDESSLALFGDQSNRSINDVGTMNEISGHISNKVTSCCGEDDHATHIYLSFLFLVVLHIDPYGVQ